jgi:hypothetical protein
VVAVLGFLLIVVVTPAMCIYHLWELDARKAQRRCADQFAALRVITEAAAPLDVDTMSSMQCSYLLGRMVEASLELDKCLAESSERSGN